MKKIKAKKSLFSKVLLYSVLIFIFIGVVFSLVSGYFVFAIYRDWLSRKDDSMATLEEYYNIIVIRGDEKKIRYFNPLNPFGNSPPTRIYDKNSILIGEYMPPAYEVVNVDDINSILENMLIVMEDQQFYKHGGVNYIRSAYLGFQSILAGRIVGGGSTLTQQLAKLLFTKSERSFKRKIFEIFVAHEIERRYEKREILAMYLNTVYLGAGNYGFEAAANYYFDKTLRECRLVEYAILVSMLPNPTYYSIVNNPENNKKKVKQILSRMYSHGFIDKNTIEEEMKVFEYAYSDLEKSVQGSQWKMTVNRTPYVNEYVRQQLLDYFDEDELALSGLKIYTTVNERHYRTSDAIIKKKIRDIQASSSDESIQGAFVAIDAKTGGIISMIGGDGYTFDNQFNRAFQAKRQIGSVMKPFIYLYAFETGLHPFTKIIDTNYTYPQGVGKEPWSPRNFNRRYMGEITIETALIKSINTVSVKLLYDVGLNYFVKNSRYFFGENAYIPNALSIGLGTVEMSPLDLASAYTVFVNYGTRFNPYIVERVVDHDGNEVNIDNLVDKAPIKIDSVSDSSYYFVNSILQKVLDSGGTASRSAREMNVTYPSFSAKTGTTSDHRDAWFVAYNTDIVVVTWIGSDKNNVMPSNALGGVDTAKAALEYLNNVIPNADKNFTWKLPEGVKVIEVCAVSGLPRNHTCDDIKPFTIGSIDISTQCPIDHLRTEDEIIEEGSTNSQREYSIDNIVELKEEEIFDPSDGKIKN